MADGEGRSTRAAEAAQQDATMSDDRVAAVEGDEEDDAEGAIQLDSEVQALEYDEEEEEEEEEDDELPDDQYDESSSPSNTDSVGWIGWFCSLPGHSYFCEVAEEFVEDDFNLTGLSALVPFYKEAMEMILDVEPEEEESLKIPDVSIVESSAELLYGLVHQRYILTRNGLQAMFNKYEQVDFGHCPRVYCVGSKLLPCGRSDLPGVDTVKLYCPNCVDMYTPPSSRFSGVDGAFFGTTFPHLLLQTYPNAMPFQISALEPGPPNPADRVRTTPLSSSARVYIPKIYGFRVSERARSGPRMQWMRMRPQHSDELDWNKEGNRALGDDPEGGRRKVEGRFDEGDEDEEEDEEEEEEEEEEGAKENAPAAGSSSKPMEAITLASSLAGPSDRALRSLPLPRSSNTGSSVTSQQHQKASSSGSKLDLTSVVTGLAKSLAGTSTSVSSPPKLTASSSASAFNAPPPSVDAVPPSFVMPMAPPPAARSRG